jgi:hypothetical protein
MLTSNNNVKYQTQKITVNEYLACEDNNNRAANEIMKSAQLWNECEPELKLLLENVNNTKIRSGAFLLNRLQKKSNFLIS